MNIVEGQGWPDMVMLDTISEVEFVSNIKKRFDKKQIYTYIGYVELDMVVTFFYFFAQIFFTVNKLS